MIEITSGSFLEGCGVRVYESKTNSCYHLIVHREKETGKLFVEIGDRRYYREDIIGGTEMRRFEVGDIFENTCIFTGGNHTHKVTERKGNTIICEAIYEEIDGTHKVTDKYEIHEDEHGEYIVLWMYKGEEGRCYASEL